MPALAPRIVIIGAGVVGAAFAFHLARRGCRVTVVDAEAAPAMGVTAASFGWINLVRADPGNVPACALLHEGGQEHEKLARDLPSAYRHARRGSLVWEETRDATEALARAHRLNGARLELVDAGRAAAIEPALRTPPSLAIHSPHDIALDAPAFCAHLLDAAGATAHFGNAVTAIETSGARVSGVRTRDGLIAADIVVVAAGTATPGLVAPLGVAVDIAASPALCLRYAPVPQVLGGIVCCPEVEMRQAADGTLILAEDAGEEPPDAVGRRMAATIAATLRLQDAPQLLSATVGMRPISVSGLPVAGFAKGIEGLYLAAGHPGVILAPLLARRGAEEMLGS